MWYFLYRQKKWNKEESGPFILVVGVILIVVFCIGFFVHTAKESQHEEMLKNGECSVETVVVSNFKVDYYGKRLREAEATAELDGENVKIIWDDTTFSFYEGKSSEPFNEGVYDRDKFKWIEKQITSDKICLRVAQVEWEDKNTLIFLSVVDG